MIEVFKTHILLPNGKTAEICKKLDNDEWLACNSEYWYAVDTKYIEENKVCNKYKLLNA